MTTDLAELIAELKAQQDKLQLQIFALRAGIVSQRAQMKKLGQSHLKLLDAFEKLVKSLGEQR